jgi:hypothetical protein
MDGARLAKLVRKLTGLQVRAGQLSAVKQL